MKMVAASKLRKAQNAITQLRPFAAKLQELLRDLSASLDSADDNSVFSVQRVPKKVLIIPITSNRGLCGAFNANIIKATNILIDEKYSEQTKSGNLSLITIGRKASEFYDNHNFDIVSVEDEIFNNLTFENVTAISDRVMEMFAKGEFDRVELVYNQFKNAATQVITAEQFLPIELVELEDSEGKHENVDYIFEPSEEEIVIDLIPKSLRTQFYKAILDSNASEHGARMTAMHQATDNATEMLKDLNLSYNKARQASITNEILEIVSGAEALKG
jgi:F-type H+-transporting ATPase subunit gamma